MVHSNFEVSADEVFGFPLPERCGKTMTIRLMLDPIRPTGGRVCSVPRRSAISPG